MLPQFPQQTNEHSLLENGSFKNISEAREKVAQDIAFLRDKIQVVQAYTKPNRLLIEHYSAMLKSRESVLSWLLHSSEDVTPSTHDVQKNM